LRIARSSAPVLLVAVALHACAGPKPAGHAARPRVLLILAHPDDETMAGATLGRLKERGAEVSALYATRGEGGKWVRVREGKPVEEDAQREPLAAQRRRELEAAARHFGITRLALLDHPDDPFDDPATGQPTRDVQRFLQSGVWRLDELRAAISKLAVEARPDVVLTLRADCPAVHAHHQVIARIALELFLAGRLGPARQIYGISEVEWYPAASLPPQARALEVPTAAFSSKLGATYAAFAQAGARHHRSQLTAYQRPPRHPELLVPLGPPVAPDPLRRLLGLDAGAEPAR
jgi:LmbE family N-acetylglucosaminyl deacetylase